MKPRGEAIFLFACISLGFFSEETVDGAVCRKCASSALRRACVPLLIAIDQPQLRARFTHHVPTAILSVPSMRTRAQVARASPNR
jgi:hypothetical protein